MINKIQIIVPQIHPTTGRANLPKDGKSLIKKLAKEQNIIINTADKGSCIVLLDRDIYIEEGRKHLDDTTTYTRLQQDITDIIKKKLPQSNWKNYTRMVSSVSHITVFCLPPNKHRTSLIYFLIKLHKYPHSQRPICSCINSVISNISIQIP